MTLDLLVCPQCKGMLRRPSNLATGSMMTCARCTHRFAIPDVRHEAAGPAASPDRTASTAPPPANLNTSLALLACPQCKGMLQRPPNLAAGSTMTCGRCKHQFPVPTGGSPEAPRPVYSPAPLVSEAAPHRPALVAAAAPVADPKEPAGETATPRSEPERPPSAPSRKKKDRDEPEPPPSGYRVDLKHWFSLARSSWGEIAGPAATYLFLLAIFIVCFEALETKLLIDYFGGQGGWLVERLNPTPPVKEKAPSVEAQQKSLLAEAIAFAFSLVNYCLVRAPIMAGLTVVALAQLKGEVWNFNELFGGFRRYFTIAFLACLSRLLFIPFEAALRAAYLLDKDLLTPEVLGLTSTFGLATKADAMRACVGFALVWLALSVVLWIKLFLFAWPAVFDRDYGPLKAMATSWRLTRGHFFELLALNFILLLILYGGLGLAFGLATGTAFVLPDPFFQTLSLLLGLTAWLISLLFMLPLVELVTTTGYLVAGGSTPPIPMEYDPDEGPASRFRGIFAQRRRRRKQE